MSKRILWNETEAALLIDFYLKYENQLISFANASKTLSKILRDLALSKNQVIDSTFRNENGINIMLHQIEYLMTDGKKGLSHSSKLFKDMVKQYKENKPSYFIALEKAKKECKL